MKPPCLVEGCDRPSDEVGRCHSHYEYWRRNGTEGGPILDTVEKRFLAKVSKRTDGCWLWIAATASEGRYGAFQYDGRVRPAHVASYLMFVGPVPEGLELDHICRVTLCVNPAHLEPVSHHENVLRGESLQAKNARKTHCKWGHPLGPYEGRPRPCKPCRKLRYEAESAGYPSIAAYMKRERAA